MDLNKLVDGLKDSGLVEKGLSALKSSSSSANKNGKTASATSELEKAAKSAVVKSVAAAAAKEIVPILISTVGPMIVQKLASKDITPSKNDWTASYGEIFNKAVTGLKGKVNSDNVTAIASTIGSLVTKATDKADTIPTQSEWGKVFTALFSK